MKLIVDTNRLLAAIIKKGKTREILHSKKFDFWTVEGAITEITKHSALLTQKTGLTEQEIKSIYNLLLFDVKIIPEEKIIKKMPEAIQIMQKIDETDAIFIAGALAINADGIYTEDKHFEKQSKIKIFKTTDLIRELQKT